MPRAPDPDGTMFEYSGITTVILLHSVSTIFGLNCYQCAVRPPQTSNHAAKLCSKFNQTEIFEKKCPFSSLCYKKTFSIDLNDQQVVVTIRDCAPQKEMRTVERNGKIEWEPSIAEVYQEGCQWTNNFQHGKVSKTQTCYCRGHLCNGQAKTESAMTADIMGIILVFNAIKYVRVMTD